MYHNVYRREIGLFASHLNSKRVKNQILFLSACAWHGMVVARHLDFSRLVKEMRMKKFNVTKGEKFFTSALSFAYIYRR